MRLRNSKLVLNWFYSKLVIVKKAKKTQKKNSVFFSNSDEIAEKVHRITSCTICLKPVLEICVDWAFNLLDF